MLKSHAEVVLDRLHDQYLRGLDCDVILTAVDHLEQNDSGTPTDGSSKNLNLTSLSCHKPGLSSHRYSVIFSADSEIFAFSAMFRAEPADFNFDISDHN